MSKKVIYITLLLTAGILLITGCSEETASSSAPPQEIASSEPQQTVPAQRNTGSSLIIRPGYEFAGLTGTTLSGETASAKLFKDHRLTLINIWTTTCPYCIEEMPDLEEVSRIVAEQDVQVIGIVGDGRFNPESALKMVEQTGVTYVNVTPSPAFEKTVQSVAYAVPTTLFVDEHGRMIGEPILGMRDKDFFLSQIEAALSQL
jgi:thiol-disulfide isomerase/thioredoxin